MGSPFKTIIGGVSPLLQTEVGKYHYTKYKKEEPTYTTQLGGVSGNVEQESKYHYTKYEKKEPTRIGVSKYHYTKHKKEEPISSEQESEPMSVGDKVDLALTGAGLTPGYGIVADAANIIQNTGQAIFNAVTGDIKEAKHDATNALWAAGAFIPAGIGQWFAGMKLAKTTTKTATKTGSKITADFLNTATEAEIKATKNLSTTEKVEILNTRVNAKIAKTAAEGGVVNGKQYYKGATHYGKFDNVKDFEKVKSEIFQGITQQGAKTDVALSKMGFKVATDLKPQHITKIGIQGNRAIFEVAFPDGTTQRFWRSSGLGGKSVTLANGTKVSSEGFFGTLPGHLDVNVPGMRINGWFVKGEKWMGYGSNTYKETGAVLKEMFEKGLIK